MPENLPELPFVEELKRITEMAVRAVGPFPQEQYVSNTVIGYLKDKWAKEVGEHHYAWTKIVEHPVIASSSFLGDGSVLDLVLARLDELAEVERELREQKKKYSEFVPHFKLHRDGSIIPQQDDTSAWTMGTMHEDVPVALVVTEDAVEEVEITREPSSWRAGGTGVPTSWNLDKIRELRDGALTEWIEVEAILREAEKRENDPVQKMVAEIQDVLYPDRNELAFDEARRVQNLARYLVEKEHS